MAQLADTTDQPAIVREPLGRWGTLRLVESSAEQTAAAGGTMRWPGDVPRPLGEPPDPGLVWVAGLPDERASAELTMRDLLSIWRAAERRLEGMTGRNGDSFLLRAQILALRATYQRLFTQIRRELPMEPRQAPRP